jgi:hypothetical protein
VLQKCGADLILHGHLHKTMLESVPGPDGPIPVVGVRSASDLGHRANRRAQYHLYNIERERRGGARRFRIALETREYSLSSRNFQRVSEQVL